MESKNSLDGFENFLEDSFIGSDGNFEELKEKSKIKIYTNIRSKEKPQMFFNKPLLFGAFTFIVILTLFLFTTVTSIEHSKSTKVDESIEEIDELLIELDKNSQFLNSIDSDLDNLESSFKD